MNNDLRRVCSSGKGLAYRQIDQEYYSEVKYRSSSWPQLRRGDRVGTPSIHPAWTNAESCPPSRKQHRESKREHPQGAASADTHDVSTPAAARTAISPPHIHHRTCVPRPPGTVRGYSAEAPHGGQGGSRMPHTKCPCIDIMHRFFQHSPPQKLLVSLSRIPAKASIAP